MKPLVYVAGPYTSPDPVENTHDTIKAAEEVEALGCDVVIPHLSLLWHIVSPAPYERWLERDLAVMYRCDGLVRLPGKSSGASNEASLWMRNRDKSATSIFFWPDEREAFVRWLERFQP